ncbi:Isoflavone reductase-like protein [Colletotrichum tropicale]|nr:Isoflavone reductase-like protein [Colletotrichum tropicale]
MPAHLKVALVGATGTTGSAIVTGLLSSEKTRFTVIALARPSSSGKPAYEELRARGVKVVPVDLKGPGDDLVKALEGVDVVISAIVFTELGSEIPLANAAKAAGVKRFLQSAFMCVVPPRGVVDFREEKENILNHIRKIDLPYTYLDAGWWYDIATPLPPSRFAQNPSSAFLQGKLGADGNVPIAIADIGDIGRYVAEVIGDSRTLNQRVFVYNEVFTQNQLYTLVERITGEEIPRTYISRKESEKSIGEAREALASDPFSSEAVGRLVLNQLFYSVTIRGDNTPHNAERLDYLDGKKLYPDFRYTSVDDYIRARV